MAGKKRIVKKKKYVKSQAKRDLPLLQTLKELNQRQRCIVLSHLNDGSCESVCEAISNVVKNPKIKSSGKLKRQLNPHKKALRFIANKRATVKQRRKKLVQLGGNPIAAILATAVPFLLNLLTRK